MKIVQENWDNIIDIEENLLEKKLLTKLKKSPNLFNKYLVKKIFEDDEINLIKNLKNSKKNVCCKKQ
jgi:transcription antitermination factor NusG